MRTRHVVLALLTLAIGEEARAEDTAQIVSPPVTVTATQPGSLTVPSAADAREQIDRTPGGVEIVPAEQYRDTKATTLKDVLEYVPGVWVQSKYGQEDAKLVIRG